MPKAPVRERKTLSPLLPALAVAAVTLIVFWPAVENQFVNWDDDKNFLNNPHYRGLGLDNLRWMFTTFHMGHYHPLTWVTLGLDSTLWGMDPKGYHLTNVLLHAANAALFYLVALRLLGGRMRAAAVAALLFAVHPLRVESVAWASERRDVLSGLFFLLTVLAYLKAHQQGPRARWLAISVLSFAAALLSKVIVVGLPLVLLAMDVYPLRRLGGAAGWLTAAARKVWLEKLAFVGPAVAAALIALALQRTGVSGFAEHVTALPAMRVALSAYGLMFYLWKTVFPFGLYPQYVMAPDVSLTGWRIVLSVVGVVAITTIVIVVRRRFPAGLVAWVCCVASLLPVLSIFRVDPQQYVADHHSYLATLGPVVLVGAALALLPARWFTVSAVAVVAILGVLARGQIYVWRDPISLWSRTLEGSPDSVAAHNNLGEALAARDRLREAIPHFERAIQIKPGYALAHYNLGVAQRRSGELEAAVRHLEEAVRTDPSFAAAHNDLANVYAALGRADAALEHYRRALELQPDFADAHYNLANLLQQQGRLEAAITHYEAALRYKPGLADAHNNWGVALDALGRSAEALEHYRQALVIDPQNADAHNNIGITLQAQGRRQAAAVHFREALRLNPAHAGARANLTRLQAGQAR